MNQFVNNAIRKLHGMISPEYYKIDPTLEIDYYINKEDKQGVHHLARYYWAREVLADIRLNSVLNIACGAGFGSFILAQFLPMVSITGADHNLKAVQSAQREFQLPNLQYIHADMVSWSKMNDGNSSPLGKYDAVVSFDTLEHLKHREIVLIRITENLPSKGILLLSTPCGHEATILDPKWEHHQNEYSYRDLQNLLQRFFRYVLLPEDGTLPGIQFWNEVVNKGKIRYLNKTNPVYCSEPIQFS